MNATTAGSPPRPSEFQDVLSRTGACADRACPAGRGRDAPPGPHLQGSQFQSIGRCTSCGVPLGWLAGNSGGAATGNLSGGTAPGPAGWALLCCHVRLETSHAVHLQRDLELVRLPRLQLQHVLVGVGLGRRPWLPVCQNLPRQVPGALREPNRELRGNCGLFGCIPAQAGGTAPPTMLCARHIHSSCSSPQAPVSTSVQVQ